MNNAQVITKLLDEIKVLRQSCREGISGEWDPSAEGFQSMIDGCDRAARLARKLKADSATPKLLSGYKTILDRLATEPMQDDELATFCRSMLARAKGGESQ